MAFASPLMAMERGWSLIIRTHLDDLRALGSTGTRAGLASASNATALALVALLSLTILCVTSIVLVFRLTERRTSGKWLLKSGRTSARFELGAVKGDDADTSAAAS